MILSGTPLSSVKEKQIAQFRRDNLGFVFQDFNLLDMFTLRDNIYLPLVLAGKSPAEMRRRIEPLARRLEIGALLNKFPYEVSGGQKQRAAVARALITEPQLLLADEPTGALDSRASGELLSLFGSLQEAGQTLIMVTHSIAAASHASRVLFIRDGRIGQEILRQGMSGDEMRQAISECLLQAGGEAR